MMLTREVRPVVRLELALVAFFGGVAALSFWLSMTFG